MNSSVDISPLSMDQATRDLWGDFDPRAIAQLAPLAYQGCYVPRLVKAPADSQEMLPSLGYVAYGMKLKPGSIIYGFYLSISQGSVFPNAQYTVQITDQSLRRRWFDDPISNLFLSNAKYVSTKNQASFPNLLTSPYPVVGSGLFLVEIQNQLTNVNPVRCQLVFGVLEVCGK